MNDRVKTIIIIIPVVLIIFGSMAATVSATQYSLTLAGPQTVAAGQTFVVSGVYTEGGEGKAGISVDIFDVTSDSICSACHDNTGTKIGSAITGEGGVYKTTVGPLSGGDYVFGALVVGSSITHPGVESDPLNVHVFSCSITLVGPETATATKNFTINGTLSVGTTGIADATITLQRSIDNAIWSNVTTNQTNSTGGYQFSKNDSAAGTYYYRTAYDGNDTYGNTTSGVVEITVLSVAPPQSMRFTDGCDKSVYIGAPTHISAAWDPSSDPDVAGYRSYWRVTSPSGESTSVTIDVGLVTSTTFTFTPAVAGVYSIQLNCTAYTTAGIEGDASNTAACSVYANAPPTPLAVTAIDPSDNVLNVPYDKVINVTFNKSVQQSTNYSNITLANGSTKVGITTAITSDLLTITPTNALTRDMTYTVTIPRDAVKNGTFTLETDFISRFTTEPKKPTTLDASAPATASVTKNFTINGTLSAGNTLVDSQTITLQRSTDKIMWNNFTTNVTNATGDYQFSKNESAAGTSYYRTAYDGNDTYGNATSAVVTVQVYKMPTQLSAAANRTVVAINNPFTINGTLNTTDGTPIAGATVQLQKNISGTWQDAPLKTATTTASGTYRISTSESTVGTYQYRATYAGDDTYVGNNSTSVSVKVVSKASVQQDFATLRTTFNNQPNSAFMPGTKSALIAVLNAAELQMRYGHYSAAAYTLQYQFLVRTDGCALRGTPDTADLVRTCAAQGQLYPQVQNLIQELNALQGS